MDFLCFNSLFKLIFFNHMLMLHQDFISVLSRRGSIVVTIRLERKEGLMSKQ